MRVFGTLFVIGALLYVAGPGATEAWLATHGGEFYRNVVEPTLLSIRS